MAKRRNVPTQYHPETDVDGKLLEPDANNDDQRWWKASRW